MMQLECWYLSYCGSVWMESFCLARGRDGAFVYISYLPTMSGVSAIPKTWRWSTDIYALRRCRTRELEGAI